MPSKAELDKMVKDCMEKKGWTEEHCRKYIAGGIWGESSNFAFGPTAGDVHIPAGMKVKKQKKTMTDDILYVPIFKTGKWKEKQFAIDDLDEIVKNTNILIAAGLLEPPIKLGHNEDQSILKRDGYPAGGYVQKIYRIGDQLFADIIDVPKKLVEAIRNRAYSKVSAEIYENFEHPTTHEPMGKVLRAIAFLGADIPEVKGLDDIGKLYHSEEKTAYFTFAEIDLQEANAMSKIWKLEDVKKYFPCCVEAVEKYLKENKVDQVSVDKLAEIITAVRMAKYQDNPEPIKCPPGYKWDEKQERCVPDSGAEAKPEEQKVCPEGWEWSDKENKCVEKKTAKASDNPDNPEAGSDNGDGDKMRVGRKILASLLEALGYDIDPEKPIEEQLPSEDEMKERIAKMKKKDESKKLPLPKADNPDDWTDEEVDEITKSAKDIDLEKEKISGFPEDVKPPKAWFDRCIARVKGKADDPQALCGWVWYHGRLEGLYAGQPTEEGGAPGPGSRSSEQNPEVKELMEKIEKLEKEKYNEMIKKLKEENRGILLPKFDEYIEKFSELFLAENKVVKFGEKETNIADLFYRFLSELVKSKAVIFSELAKSNNTGGEMEMSETEKSEIEKEKQKIIETFTELAKETNTPVDEHSLEVAKKAVEIRHKNKNIGYAESLRLAEKELSGGEKK